MSEAKMTTGPDGVPVIVVEMTDRELFDAFLKQSGLDQQSPGKLGRYSDELIVERNTDALFGAGGSITLHEGIGYSGFYAVFEFDKDGKFVSFGVWE